MSGQVFAPSAPESAPKIESATLVEKCPNCGANMEYAPAEKCLKCAYCGSEKQIDVCYGEELNFANIVLQKDSGWANETHVYRCNNCNAEQILDKRDISTTCPFCGTTNVVEVDAIAGLKPSAILPFLIGKEDAKKIVTEWVKKKICVPAAFKRTMRAEEFRGIYSPAFTFDTNTVSQYNGRLGEYYYVTERVNGKDVRRRKTRYFNVGGTFTDSFDDILVQASDLFSDKVASKLGAYDIANNNAYTDEFLYGFSARQYSKNGQECWKEARGRIESELRGQILAQYRYDVVDYLNVSTACNNITYKYLLLPVYIGHYTYKKKTYHFYINGRTGKLTGKLPFSLGVVGWVLLGLLAAGAVSGIVKGIIDLIMGG